MEKVLFALVSGGVITYILGWLAGRKKNKAETEGLQLENLNSAIEIYKKVHDQLKEQLERLSDKCSKLSVKIDELQKENERLRNEIHSLNQRLKNRNHEN